MKNFAAIDFETANNELTSICSLGIVIVHDGKTVEKIYKLVKPEPNYYYYMNTKCHGLSATDTNTAPLFPYVWSEIEAKLEGLPLIAHNKSFDERCLISCCKMYRIDYPDYKFSCTLQASRKHFPQLPNHRLDTVAAHIGYDLRNHHNALADAEACAEIAKIIL